MKALALSLATVLAATFAHSLPYAQLKVGYFRHWRLSVVANITSETGEVVAAPIGTMIVGVRITKTPYWIRTEATTYVFVLQSQSAAEQGPLSRHAGLNASKSA